MLLQLLTQRRAMEKKPQGVDRNKTVPLCRVLRKEGVLSDPEKLMEKAPQVRSVLSTTLHIWNRNYRHRIVLG